MMISFTIKKVLGWLIINVVNLHGLAFCFVLCPPIYFPYMLSSNLFEASAESFKHFLHVATLLHGDNSCMILLIHPD